MSEGGSNLWWGARDFQPMGSWGILGDFFSLRRGFFEIGSGIPGDSGFGGSETGFGSGCSVAYFFGFLKWFIFGLGFGTGF